MFKTVGLGGAFHAAVEVCDLGKEWSYGATHRGSGVFSDSPRGCAEHDYRQSVSMGRTTLTAEEVADVLTALKAEWGGASYTLLTHNCCHFCDRLCRELKVVWKRKEGPIPAWLLRLAETGSSFSSIGKRLYAPSKKVFAHKGTRRTLAPGAAAAAAADADVNGGAAVEVRPRRARSTAVFSAGSSCPEEGALVSSQAAQKNAKGGGWLSSVRVRSPEENELAEDLEKEEASAGPRAHADSSASNVSVEQEDWAKHLGK
jgi:hypothetical protein